MTTPRRENILREIDAAIDELRAQSGWLNERKIERLELEREWIRSHPSPTEQRPATTINLSALRFPNTE